MDFFLVANAGPVIGARIPLPVAGFRIAPDGCIAPFDGAAARGVRVILESGAVYVECLSDEDACAIGDHPISERTEVLPGMEIRVGEASYQLDPRCSLDEERERQTYTIAVTDSLTGVANRRMFLNQMTAEIAFSTRHSKALTVLLVDVDFLDTFNKTYGYEAGDLILRALGALLDKERRTEDLLARYGSDEFVLVLREVVLEDAVKMAERLLARISANEIEFRDQRLAVSASIGISASDTGHDLEIEAFLSSAQDALRHAKDNGRDAVYAVDYASIL